MFPIHLVVFTPEDRIISIITLIMESSRQLVIFSTIQDQAYTHCAFDLQTGTVLTTYKDGGISGRKCVIVANNNQYLISAEKDKARIHIWHLNKRNSFHKTIISPGIVNALAITPCSNYLLAAIGNKIFIWQLSSGNLITTLERHYQTIVCLKCSEDGYYFISAAQDGHCLLWEFGEIFSQYSNLVLQSLTEGVNEPKYSWTDHQKEITDVYCGNYLTTARCMTVSLDASCKMYDVTTGQLIVSIIFDTPIHSLAVDPAEMNLFVGGDNGKIYQTKLYKEIDDFTSTLINSKPEFIGHSSKVTCLAVSFDGLCLISASSDCKIKKWHIPSKNCMDTYSYKAPIINCFTIFTPNGILINNSTNSLEHFVNLKREISNQINDDGLDQGTIEIRLDNSMHKSRIESGGFTQQGDYDASHDLNSNLHDVNNMKEQMEKLKRINKQLFQYQLQKVYRG